MKNKSGGEEKQKLVESEKKNVTIDLIPTIGFKYVVCVVLSSTETGESKRKARMEWNETKNNIIRKIEHFFYGFLSKLSL